MLKVNVEAIEITRCSACSHTCLVIGAGSAYGVSGFSSPHSLGEFGPSLLSEKGYQVR